MKFLYQPVTPWIVNQKFGENKVCVDLATGKKVIMCDGLNPPLGYKSVYSQMKGHSGIDTMARRWQPVYASAPGWVEEVQTESERGLGVGVITDQKYPCTETGANEFFKYRNWHFIGINVHKGDKVVTGSLLGWADSTGYSTADHLHFELKPVTLAGGGWVNILQDNGYFGAVDPEPYMENIFALKIRDIVSAIMSIREKLAKILDKASDTMRGQ